MLHMYFLHLFFILNTSVTQRTDARCWFLFLFLWETLFRFKLSFKRFSLAYQFSTSMRLLYIIPVFDTIINLLFNRSENIFFKRDATYVMTSMLMFVTIPHAAITPALRILMKWYLKMISHGSITTDRASSIQLAVVWCMLLYMYIYAIDPSIPNRICLLSKLVGLHFCLQRFRSKIFHWVWTIVPRIIL